jgi:hypothetical protein
MTVRLTTRDWHGQFLMTALHGEKLRRYTDGGPSDLNRARKRAKGKAQRQARKRQRRAA